MSFSISAYLFFLVPFFAAIAFLASLTAFSKLHQEVYLKAFSMFLLFNCIQEGFASFLAVHNVNNVFVSNVLTLIVITFYLYLVRAIIYSKKTKNVFLYFLIGYPVLGLGNILLVQKDDFHTMTYSLGCLLVVTFCIYYFWELFQRPRAGNLLRQPHFWISSGLLFYYACSFPLLGLLNFIRTVPKVVLENLLTILVILTFFLYLSFTIAFLCRLRTRKSTL